MPLQSFAEAEFRKSGGHGILIGLFSQVVVPRQFVAKMARWKALTAFLLVLVITVRCVSFGNRLSTVSAQFADIASSAQGGRSTAAKRRRRRVTDSEVSAIASSYGRFSSDLQDESSIIQQQRKCRERAESNNHQLRPEFEFSDEAVSGTVRRRDGLDQMLQAASDGKFGVLYLFSLSRLARESLITMGALKHLVYVDHVRVICVSEGIDTNVTGWQIHAQVHAAMDEEYIRKLREAVLSGQEQNVLNEFSNGDYCFGYSSESVPGTEIGRRGRDRRPRMRAVINPEHAAWVTRIFIWFVKEHRSMNWIATELTRLGARRITLRRRRVGDMRL